MVSIVKCGSLTFVFSQTVARSLVQLQKLEISGCDALEHMIMEEDGNVTSSDNNQTPCFGNLETLQITWCDKLKYIMSISMARSLEKLKYISVSYDEELKQIFGREEEERSSEQIVLPLLSELSGIQPNQINGITCPSLQKLEVWRWYETDLYRLVNGKQLQSLGISWSPAETWYSLLASLVKQPLPTLKHIHLSWIHRLHQIFHFEGVGNEEPLSLVSIESLRLYYLLDLREIWSGCIYTPNLTHLHISMCDSLSYIFSPTLARNLPLLRELTISWCGNVEAIIGENHHGESSHPSPTYFPNLENIKIANCIELKYIFPISVAVGGLSKLSSLHVKLNHKLEGIFEGVKEVDDTKILVLPLLVKMKLYDLPMLKSFSPVGYHLIFPRLDYLTVSNCDNVATNFTFVSSDTSVHGETKDDSKGLGSGFIYKYKKQDLHSYLSDGSLSQDQQSLKSRHEGPRRRKKDKTCSVM